MKIMVSACLFGKNTKYNGKNNINEKLMKFLENDEVFLVCPELMGGLPVPRDPSEILNTKVITNNGKDVTNNFKVGAKKTLDIIKKEKIKVAILKKNSPSCGFGTIYDGTFSHHQINGNGITADLLNQHGVTLLNEDNYEEYFKRV